MGRVLSILFAILVVAGCGPSGFRYWLAGDRSVWPDHGIDRGVESAENEYDRIARELKEAEAGLGRAAGRRLIGRAATGVLAVSGLIAAASVVVLFVGGPVTRGRALMGFGVAAAGVTVGYFITVYGVIVSEVLCWALMLSIGIGGPLVAFVFIRAWLDARTARQILEKRIEEGRPAPDAFQRLPVSRKTKSRLDDAFETLRTRAGSAFDQLEARQVLGKLHLPLPNPEGE